MKKNRIILAAFTLVLVSGCNRNPAIVCQRDIQAGQKYFDQHKYDYASLEFRRALQANPKSADAKYRLGLSYMQLRRWSEAYRAFTQAVTLNPENTNARMQVAELDLAGNQLQDAEQQISEILKRDKNSVEGLILSGRLAIQTKSYSDAELDFTRASHLAPRDTNALNFLADTYVLLRNYDQAAKTYQKAIEIDPSSVASYLNLAELYSGEGKSDEQTSILLTAIQRNPKALAPYLLLADAYFKQGHPERLTPLFEQLRSNTGSSPTASLAIAQFYLAHGQPQESKSILSELVGKDSSNLQARKALIEVDLDVNQTAEADKLNRELLKQYPRDPDARLYEGRLLLAANKVPDAISLLQELIHDAPEMASARYALGIAYGQQGEVDREIDSLKASTARNPNLIQAYIALAGIYLQRVDGKLALSYADEALKRNPRLLVPLLTRANAELLLHNPQGAEQELAALATADPKNPMIQERLGYAQLMQHKFAEATARFEEALKLQPDFVPAVQDLYTVYQAQNKPNLAIARVQQQIQRAPQQGYFYELLGNIYQGQDKFEQAEDAYKEALAHTRTNQSEIYAHLAQIYDVQHKYSLAIADAQDSLTQNPNLLSAYIFEGTAYQSTGQVDQAKQAYRNAIAHNPDFAVALNNLAWLECEHGGNLDEALGLAQHAKQLMPGDPSVSDTLAWIEYRKGLYQSALPLASEATRRSPSVGQFQYHLGMILVRAGDRTRGRQALERSLALPSDAADAENARATLKAIR